MKSLLSWVAFAATAISASAVPINITIDAAGALLNISGVANKAQYEAAVLAGDPLNTTPASNPSDVEDFLDGLIGRWNAVLPALSPVLPASGAFIAGAPTDDNLGDAGSYSGPSGYQYAVIHYGGGAAGGQGASPGGWYSAYYLGGAALDIASLPQVGGESVGGFSSIRYFGTDNGGGVPDGGSTALLLGFGTLGLALAARRT